MVALGLLLISAACAPPPRTIAAITPAGPSASASTEATAAATPTATASATAASTATPAQVQVLKITSATFHAGEVGIAYSAVTLTASGGVPPYSWAISAGALPGGLSVSSSGSVSGTPTAAGSFAFTVHVGDAASDSAIVNRAITVAAYLSISGLCNTPQCNVEQGCVTVCGTFGRYSGGVGGFTYAVTGGTSLPPGMGLAGLAVTGPFPPEVGVAAPAPWRFQVTMTDSLGATATVAAVFHVVAHLTWLVSTATCAAATAPFTCSTSQLQYTGGVPGTTPGWKIVQVLNANGAPEPAPKGFTVSFKAPSVIVTVPNQGANYYGVMTLILTDPTLCAPSTACPSTGNATITIRV